MKPKVLLRADFVTPTQAQGQSKWYITVEANGAYKHTRQERIWLKNDRIKSYLKEFATRPLDTDNI